MSTPRVEVYNNHSKTTIKTYHVIAFGIDNEGKPCRVVLNFDGYASGCNPVHWSKNSTAYQVGHGFRSLEDADDGARYAALSYNVRGVDFKTIKIHEITTITEQHVDITSAFDYSDNIETASGK